MKETLQLHNDVNQVTLLTEWVEQIGEKFQLSSSAVFQLNLALEEAVVNVIDYAYPEQEGMPIFLDVEKQDDSLMFELRDKGLPFDPTKSQDPDLTLPVEERPIGGLGIFLVRNIMAAVSYARQDDTNILTMTYKQTQ